MGGPVDGINEWSVGAYQSWKGSQPHPGTASVGVFRWCYQRTHERGKVRVARFSENY